MLAVGDQAPDFTLLDQNGVSVSLSDYKGKKKSSRLVLPEGQHTGLYRSRL